MRRMFNFTVQATITAALASTFYNSLLPKATMAYNGVMIAPQITTAMAISTLTQAALLAVGTMLVLNAIADILTPEVSIFRGGMRSWSYRNWSSLPSFSVYNLHPVQSVQFQRSQQRVHSDGPVLGGGPVRVGTTFVPAAERGRQGQTTSAERPVPGGGPVKVGTTFIPAAERGRQGHTTSAERPAPGGGPVKVGTTFIPAAERGRQGQTTSAERPVPGGGPVKLSTSFVPKR